MTDVVDPWMPKAPPGQRELPTGDGQPMESQRHFDQMRLLVETLRTGWESRSDFYVGGDMFVYFSELQWKGGHFRGPDVFVVLDTERKERLAWVAWEEGGRLPDVVIELISPSTERVDRGEKKRIYERVWRTDHYVLYDPFTHALEGWVRRNGTYEPLAPDARGDLPIESMGVALGLRAGRTRDSDAETWLRWIWSDGTPMPTGAEMAREAETKAREAESKAREAEARVAKLEAELARLRGG